MTIKECIDIVDDLKPNQYSTKVKVMWLSFIDEIIINDVLKTHKGYDGRYDDFTGYSEDKLSVPLIVKSPYDRLYTAYLKMKIDAENGETARYNNSASLFNSYLMEYKKFYNKTHMPLSAAEREKANCKATKLDVTEAQLEYLKRELYPILAEDINKAVSDDKIYDIVMNYVNNNAQMLKGKDGVDGVDGKDGYTPIKGKDYFDGKQGKAFTYDDFTQAQLAALRGEKGDKGDKGDQGVKGDKGDKGDKGEDGKDAVIDQTYTPTSPNAQSGLATAEAVGVANDYTDKAIKSSKTYANNTFAPAIKNNVTGEHIAINDVSSIEHNLQIKLLSDTITDFSAVNVSRCGKNIFDFEGFANEIIEAGRNCEIVEFDGRRCFKIISTTTQFTRDLSRFKAFGIQFDYYAAGTYTKSFFAIKFIDGNILYFGASMFNAWTSVNYNYPYDDKQMVEFRCYCATDEENPIYIDLDSFMIEESQAPTDYEPYNGQTVTANEDGSVDGLTSLSPNMTIITDTEDINIDCIYNADTKMYIDNKIAELL